VTIGDLTSLLETTCIRKTSAMERLSKPTVENKKVFMKQCHALEVCSVQPGDEDLAPYVN
jgi:hypothetical protein